MSKKTVLGIALGLAGGYLVANAAGAALLSASACKRMKEHENGNNMMHSSAIGHKNVELSPDVEHAYINCLNGSTNVVLSSIPTHTDMYIDLGSACAAYSIKLPANVKIDIEGTGKSTVVKNNYTSSEEDYLATIHIDISHTAYSSIKIDSL